MLMTLTVNVHLLRPKRQMKPVIQTQLFSSQNPEQ